MPPSCFNLTTPWPGYRVIRCWLHRNITGIAGMRESSDRVRDETVDETKTVEDWSETE